MAANPDWYPASRTPDEAYRQRITAQTERVEQRHVLRDNLAELLANLALLDRHPEWSAQQIGTARGLITQMEQIARVLEAEKGASLRAAM